MSSKYVRERTKLFRSLADHCHDKTLSALQPSTARDWAVLMDACLWMSDPDAEVDYLTRLFKEPSQ